MVKIFSELDSDTAYDIEELLISLYGREKDGGILTNICDSRRPPDITGLVRSDEVRSNMSKAQKGRIITDEHRKNMCIAQQKRTEYKPHTAEAKAKMSASKTGKKASDETRKKLSDAQRGKHEGEKIIFMEKNTQKKLGKKYQKKEKE